MAVAAEFRDRSCAHHFSHASHGATPLNLLITQGNLLLKRFELGQPYTSDLYGPSSSGRCANSVRSVGTGPWPDHPTGTLGGELVIGRTFGVFSAEIAIGTAGADHTLAAHLRVWPFGALYLHTNHLGV
ncbi:hypothetical protein [Nonomuraea sp. NPDC005650]|uniref:hypothetical protein n=1 Tax=Nonomuraea sp. NPDC005650 TaxID=3157045 RepID=UPI0033BB1694